MSYNVNSKNAMTLKEFGDKFINEDLEPIVNTNPYLSFFILSAAIEFITRCREHSRTIHYTDNTRQKYISTIDDLEALKPYRIFKKKQGLGYTNVLYSAMRCGLLHAGLPNSGITLSSDRNELDRRIVGCKDLYANIKKAWIEIQRNPVIDAYIKKTKAIMIQSVKL